MLATLQLNYLHEQVCCATPLMRKNSLASVTLVEGGEPLGRQCTRRHIHLYTRAQALPLKSGEGVSHSLKWIFWPHTSQTITHSGFCKAVLLWNFACITRMLITPLPASLGLPLHGLCFLTFISRAGSFCFLWPHCICITLPWTSACLLHSSNSFCKIHDTTSQQFRVSSTCTLWQTFLSTGCWRAHLLVSLLEFNMLCHCKVYSVLLLEYKWEYLVSLHTREIG